MKSSSIKQKTGETMSILKPFFFLAFILFFMISNPVIGQVQYKNLAANDIVITGDVNNISGSVYQGIYSTTGTIGGTTTLKIIPNKSIYRVDISENATLAFDFSNVNFTNKIVTFELWLAQLNASASISFDHPIYWVSGQPSLNAISTNYFVIRALSTNEIHGNLQYLH